MSYLTSLSRRVPKAGLSPTKSDPRKVNIDMCLARKRFVQVYHEVTTNKQTNIIGTDVIHIV